MARYRKFDREKVRELAARRHPAAVSQDDILIGTAEETAFLHERLPVLLEQLTDDVASECRTLSTEESYCYTLPGSCFVAAYNGKANTAIGGVTYQTSQSIVPFEFDAYEGKLHDMVGLRGKSRTRFEELPSYPSGQSRCISIKTKDEAIQSCLQNRSASYHFQKLVGYEGIAHCNNPPARGKAPRGRPAVTKVNSGTNN